MSERPLSSFAWLRSEAERGRYVVALVSAPAGVVIAAVVVVAGLPAPLVLLPIILLLASALHMHLLAADRLQLLRHNSAEMHWLHYKAVWRLHLGGPLRQRG